MTTTADTAATAADVLGALTDALCDAIAVRILSEGAELIASGSDLLGADPRDVLRAMADAWDSSPWARERRAEETPESASAEEPERAPGISAENQNAADMRAAMDAINAEIAAEAESEAYEPPSWIKVRNAS